MSDAASRPAVAHPPRRADRPPPGASCVHRQFASRAARDPGAVALTVEGRHTTYGELDARSDRLARKLRALGVGPETPVGLFVERSAAMIVGILGVLKAGGAYVPLDPAYPAARLALILEDARAPVLLTQGSMRDRLPEHDALVIDLDDEAALDSLPEADAADGGARPGNLAYVIYTSGSTGRPKGVAVTHANVARLFSATRAWFGFGPADVWTLFHSVAFDFSVWEVWGALIHGGRLVVVPHLVSRSPAAFLGLLRDERVTVLNQTPSAFRQLARADGLATAGVGSAIADLFDSRPEGRSAIADPTDGLAAAGDPLSLRLVIFGGEALDPRSLRDWIGRRGDETPRLINMYGITETTVHVTYRRVTAADLELGGSPIGRAIPDLRLYLLDPRLEPVPVGVVGELHVGGPGLARGYLDRPGLTAERFVPDPFGATPGGRLYKSGDLARRRADGDLDYVGRSDHQVKVRGFRIELGEIEAALASHPGVVEAVVLAREDREDDRRLVAYVVPAGDAPDSAALRDWLRPRLPSYMVPSAIVAIDSVPLTPHGKLDRAALPSADRASVGPAFVEPRTATESAVASAWAGVLGLARVGATDHFFDLGGHSLLATQAAYRLVEALGVEVPVRLLFEAPTVAALAARIDAARLDGLAPASPPIRARPREGRGPAPLSFAQEALWYLDRLDPGRATFNVTAAFRVAGPLDADALARALDEIARRHEVLRATFPTVDDRPVQVVAADLGPRLDRVDLSGLPEADRLAEAARLAAEEGRRPFSLARGPLVRATLIRLGDRDHAVLLTMHHIITDGWSIGVAAGELAALYPAIRDGRPSPLRDLTIQYADYAHWQRDRLRGEELDRLLGYWRARLDGLPALELPTDRPRPPARSSRGETLGFALGLDLSRGLRGLGRAEGVTPFMALLAGFQVLLHRHGGQEDFAVGSPIAGRDRAETEGLIGYFVNMLVLRADLSGDPSFRALLGRVREASLGAFEHQALPLNLLVEALQPRRDPSRTPLFQAMFVLQNAVMPDLDAGALAFEPLDVGLGTGTAKFDLALGMVESADGFLGSIEYSTDLFDAPTIERMIGHFLALLAAAVADPDRPVSDLDMLSDAERDGLLDAGGANAVGPEEAAGAHHLFEAQARRTPDLEAVVAGGLALTYRELDARADRLAGHLRRLGVGPESRVGIALDRSLGLAVGLLGILKAGGAYVPLDPAYPRERLRVMAEEAGVELALVDARSRIALAGAVAIPLDPSELPDSDLDEPGPVADPVAPENLVYVNFTSGTTGTPRAVAVAHRGLVNHNRATASMFGLGAGDRVLQFCSISFDIAAEEIFPAWSAGASVVFRDDEYLDVARFADRLGRDRITVVDLPTAFWHAWVKHLSATGGALPDALRLVVVGGEEASATVYEAWLRLAGGRVRWINTYGPTEATIIATAFEPASDTDATAPAGRPPIGRPIAGARAYVLDAEGRLAPPGTPGELYLGGVGLARGYLGRPGATAERFVPDPFGPEPGGRLYRTGDRARWRPDGDLEFLGRLDDQVKVRGHRIEPGDVEAALLAAPEVREAAVVVRDAGGDGALIVAYVVGHEGRPVSVESVRRSLRGRLPRYLLPGPIVVLGAMPLTPAGKVDRRALPGPGPGDLDAGRAPRDAVESRLVAIWEELLPTRPIGVLDDFFDLGGHSLLAIRLLARVEAEFGRRLPLASLVRGATVEDVAALVRAPGSSPSSPLVPIRPEGAATPFFCVHPAGGIVYCFQELARRVGDRPFLGLQAAGLDDDATPRRRIEEMASDYADAIVKAYPDGPYHVGGWSLGGLVAFEMARQLAERGHEVATVALIDSEAPRPGGTPVPAWLGERGEGAVGLGVLDDPDADPLDDALILAAFGPEMAVGVAGGLRGLATRLRKLDVEERRRFFIRHFRLDGVYHLETGPDRVARLLRVLRANLAAGARYDPGSPYPGRLLVLRAGDRVGDSADPTLGWGRLAAGGATCRAIPGDHASILAPPGVEELAEAIRSAIEGGEGPAR